MDTRNKCCGNCKHFQNESATGNGWCNENDWISNVDKVCKCHDDIDNGWTEITPNNVEELYESKERVCVAFVCNGEVSYMCGQFGLTLSTMAKYGGYYYYVLPELKIE